MSRRLRAVCAVVAALVAVGCGSAGPSSPTDAPAALRRVVVLGDSLAVSPSIDQSFPTRLQNRIDERRLRWTVANAGVSGDTTADGVRRVEPLLTADVGVLVVALGANDGIRGIATATVEANLAVIMDAARRRSIRVLLCGMEAPPTRGLDYTLAFHAVFPRLATQYAVPLVPFLLAGVALNPELNGPDFVHPNAAGAARIAETVWPYLEPLL